MCRGRKRSAHRRYYADFHYITPPSKSQCGLAWGAADRRFYTTLPAMLSKVFGRAFFKKLAGRGQSPRRSPQRAKLPQCSGSEEKRGLGEETPKGVASPIHRSFAPLNAKNTNPNPYLKRPVSSTPAAQSRGRNPRHLPDAASYGCRCGGAVNNPCSNGNGRAVNQTSHSPASLSRPDLYRMAQNALNVQDDVPFRISHSKEKSDPFTSMPLFSSPRMITERLRSFLPEAISLVFRNRLNGNSDPHSIR